MIPRCPSISNWSGAELPRRSLSYKFISHLTLDQRDIYLFIRIEVVLIMSIILTVAASTIQRILVATFHLLTGRYFLQTPQPTPTPPTMKHIVILGGSYAGVSTAHRILKNVDKAASFKITLVSPNTHFYWNMASPRGLIPGQLTDEQLFLPIAAGFSKYSADQFEFINGSAESVDAEGKKVVIATEARKVTLDYDMLVIATGSRTKEPSPLKALGSTEETRELLHEFQEKIAKAKTIVVAGAGATGVEVAGELGFEYGREKEIILVRLWSTSELDPLLFFS